MTLLPAHSDQPLPEPWERQPGETTKSWAAFQLYRDLSPAERTQAAVAKAINRHWTQVQMWAAKYNWSERVAAWDRECDRIAVQARKDEIERINRRHIQLASDMLDQVEAAVPAAGPALVRQPHAIQEWAKTATEIQRKAAGIADPDKRMVVAGDPDAPVQHDVAGLMAHLDPATVLKARELAIEVAKAQAREAAGVTPPPQLPPVDEEPSEG